jgi:GT2 family glycosyltransferase
LNEIGAVSVSVVVPTYRRPRQLQACLEALASQTMQEPWEVVIVDDGSPEPPNPSVERLVAARGWQLVRQANAGPSAARNRGVREARGEFIAFTDDDCRPEPSWLVMLLREARARPHVLIGGTTVNGLKGDFFATTSQLIVDLVYEHFNADPAHGYFLASNNILCSRAGFQKVGGFDESFPRAGAEDRDFCDRWRMRGWPIAWRPDARVEHRHGQSFRQFVDLYIRYGRGAYRYQAIRKERGSGSMRADLSFHKTLPRRVWRHLKLRGRVGSGIATVAALSVWQVANAAGFLLEAILASEQRKSTRSQPAPSHRDP